MSVKIKMIRDYRLLLNKRLLGANKRAKQSIKTKNRVLDFFEKNGKFPSRLGKTKAEKSLATRFENYISKENPSYDPELRKLAMANGRTTNNKRKHNVKKFKEEILAFIEKHGRVPSTSYVYQTIEGEATLRHKLDYYTRDCNDMTFLAKVYAGDLCHKSGIPSKIRPLLNQLLDVPKPLVRLV